MPTTRKKPQDHKPKATDAPESITVTARDVDWTIEAAVMDDMEFLEDIEAMNSGNLIKLPGFCRRLLGDEQYDTAKDIVRDDAGRVRPSELMDLITEILGAESSAGVAVGESSAS